MVEHISIEVPNCEGNDWLTLTFSSNFNIAAEHAPIVLEETISYPLAKQLAQYTKATVAKLRSVFHAHRCEFQLLLAPFGHCTDQPEVLLPNIYAFNLALLLADLHFSNHIELEEHSALEAGFNFSKGLVELTPTQVAPSNKQADNGNVTRSSLVYRLDNANQISHYQAIFSDQPLKQVQAFIPQERYESCVYFPLVDNASGKAEQLSFIKVSHVPAAKSQLSIFGLTPNFSNEIRKLINQNTDLRMLLSGQIFIECGERPAKKHKSWEFALVTALQMALGLLPRVERPVICTGQVTPKTCVDSKEQQILIQPIKQARKLHPVGDTDKKYNLIKSLKESVSSSTSLLTSLNQPVKDINTLWLFYLPEENYYTDQKLYSSEQIEVFPIEFWHFEELLSL
ncbi:hypothetical protein [Thalassotalea castellviae]|uniref:Uncharacterized protein n=1 Tax=Thalassotalea castellviae TaxID=3075612 RepID=A0ABU3A3C7_9GAMM|nr:hypothetical protein [Thalassotalea sp. W431]MDT0604310.1 hypothetical protein [Thalassotalea sp. W431]